MEELEDLSDSEPASCELVRVVPCVSDVIDVPVSPSSVVTELSDVPPCCIDWELLEPQFFSFSKKRVHWCTDMQEEMRYEGSPVITPPHSRRSMTPPAPVQNSYTSIVRDHGRYEVEEENGMREKEQSSRGQNNFWKEAAV